tara:strand:+ start:215 stop:1084 length:870 start_codon:yes stop_codon:yes gene_type:complete
LENTFQDSKLRRIALVIQYDGASFSGWQRQKNNPSIQETLEDAIESLDPLGPCKTFAAGRTDSGVHAAGQVVHFDCLGTIPPLRWSSALNGRLPKTIRVIKSIDMPFNWHSCYSAIYRRYRYTIHNSITPNLFLDKWTWHRYKYSLDTSIMRSALDGLIGLHDFSAFQRSGSKRINALTTIQEVHIQREGDLIFIEIQATGFLYGMVRLLVGQLVGLGEHRFSLDDFETRWRNRRRKEIKESAPAHGLCFLKAGYKESILSQELNCCFMPKFFISKASSPPIPPQFDSL